MGGGDRARDPLEAWGLLEASGRVDEDPLTSHPSGER